MRKRLGSEAAAAARFDLIDKIKDLLGLSENPRMLTFIADLPEDDLRAAQDKSGVVTAAALYQKLLDRFLGFEVNRIQRLAPGEGLDLAARYDAVTRLAVRLWGQSARTVGVEDLEAPVQAVLNALAGGPAGTLSTAEAVQQVGSGTLLRRDAEGRFSFFHESVLEWLVARAAAEECRGPKEHHDKPTHSLLAKREVSSLFAEFFHGLLGADAAYEWAAEMLLSEEAELGDAAGVLKRNAQTVIERLGRAAPERQNFAGQPLAGRDFSFQTLRGAKFARANLRGARCFKADLRGADFEGADLTRADLLGADLRGARFGNTRLVRARLVGAKLSEGALANLAPKDGFGRAQGPECEWMREQRIHGEALAFSPDGGWVAVGTGRAITLWDVETSRPIRVLRGHEGRVTSVAFSGDGTRLASGSADGTVRLWDMATGAQRKRSNRQQKPTCGTQQKPGCGTRQSMKRGNFRRRRGSFCWIGWVGITAPTPSFGSCVAPVKRGMTPVTSSPTGRFIMSTTFTTTPRSFRLSFGAFVRSAADLYFGSGLDFRTGLYNAGSFEELLCAKVDQAQRVGAVLSLLRIDLDHFKQINDSLGHDVADELLTELGRLFGRRKRTDCVARVGGEEFGIILWGTGLQGARHKAETLRQDIEAMLSVWLAERTGRATEKVTASFGVATLEPEAEAEAETGQTGQTGQPGQPGHTDPEEAAQALNRRADQLQRLAKLRGRNRVEWDLASATPEEQAQLGLDVKPGRLCSLRGQRQINVDLGALFPFSLAELLQEAVPPKDPSDPACPQCEQCEQRKQRKQRKQRRKRRAQRQALPTPSFPTPSFPTPLFPTPFLATLKRVLRPRIGPVALLAFLFAFFGPCDSGSSKKDVAPPPSDIAPPEKCTVMGIDCGDVLPPPTP